MNILYNSVTHCGVNNAGYSSKAEAEAVKAKVEARTRKMPGLISLNVGIFINNETGGFVIYDSSAYDEDERRRLTRQPA